MPQFNKKWFIDKLADHQLSQRRLAAMLHLDPAAMNRTFKGVRRMQLDEAAAFANVVGVPIEEVLVNAGIEPGAITSREGKVAIKGWIDGEFNVHAGGVKGERWVSAPPQEAPGLEALRYRTANSIADALDGVIAYYRPRPSVSLDAMGRWCVVRLPDGAARIRVLKPGYRRGTYNLMNTLLDRTEEDVVVESASPIVWMKF
jgi:hypothetical protein